MGNNMMTTSTTTADCDSPIKIEASLRVLNS